MPVTAKTCSLVESTIMSYANLLLSADGAIATVTINRPKALNALNEETLHELAACFHHLATDAVVKVIILTGAGDKAFVAGADISHMQRLSPLAARTFARLGQQVMQQIENLDKPVICAVNGFALGGGCELALCCDIRLAADNARFGQPEINLGIIPGFAGTQRLPRLIGKGRAAELLYTGDMIDANEALRVGMVNRVIHQAELQEAAQALASKIAAKSPIALALCKQALHGGAEMDLERACNHEADLFALAFSSEDQREGMAAFLEKRPPQFSGK